MALQYGGGGFNGVLTTGLAPLRDAAPGDPLPIMRGYATFGTDSGHQASALAPSEPGAFALNDEMLENFAFASYKKVKDVAMVLTRTHYGRAPARVYSFGGSEGGREGLTMAQRFPADYDGIVSVVPVINWTGLFHAFVRNQVPQFADWLDAGKTTPASTHTGTGRSVTDKAAAPTMVDLLDPLDRWVTTGGAPPDARVQTSKAPLPPYALQAPRPMCRYPNYPHYLGGDRLQAASCACRAS